MSLGFIGIAGFCALCKVDVPYHLRVLATDDSYQVTATCHGSTRSTTIAVYDFERAKTRGGEYLPASFLLWLRSLFADEADTEIRLLIAYNRGRTLQERVGCACGCSAHP